MYRCMYGWMGGGLQSCEGRSLIRIIVQMNILKIMCTILDHKNIPERRHSPRGDVGCLAVTEGCSWG